MGAKARLLNRSGAIAAVMGVSIVVGLVAWTSPAQSVPDYMNQFNERYDTRGSRIDDCATCHAYSSTEPPDATNMNGYATDFASNGYDFAAIESLDSDGDGFTNIDEIKALTFPGNPDDNPKTQ